jgi:hypothetical protein
MKVDVKPKDGAMQIEVSNFKLHPGALLYCRETACACADSPGVCECDHPCGAHTRTGICTDCACETFRWARAQS